MNIVKATLLSGLFGVLALCAATASADRTDKYEFTLQIPYAYGDDIDFGGGANVDVNSDAGFGFTMGYNYSEQLNLHGNFTWNSVSYDATRVLDDGDNTEEKFGGVLDTFSASVAGDYYFIDGPFTPFVNASLGWTYIDSNVASGRPESLCYWDPWWGYICDYYQPTYNSDSWSYGLGAGVRFDMNDHYFIRAGYYERWIDIDEAKGSPSTGILSLEFGFMY